MRVSMIASATLVAVGVLSACSSDGGIRGRVVAINENCVFVEVEARPNQCVPPNFNADAVAAKIGDCFRLAEDTGEHLTAARRVDCP
jgi:hypothetical protein